jgi:hypothetical protein
MIERIGRIFLLIIDVIAIGIPGYRFEVCCKDIRYVFQRIAPDPVPERILKTLQKGRIIPA